MRTRQRLKMLKQVAEKQALKLNGFGYNTKITKIDNTNDFVVHADNGKEEITIFVDRQDSPFHTWTLKKR
ncbi:hypothetical protein [Rummeliibacillus stabekisii]|uniref:PepSY domain-containing protein n=1 Tax=Rummeliibacillus stabekisii TaxID=241244 RepID=A0A143HDJ3_9BACL|nr:hypothetical protein [Rummeliibacillus stabekisii]AMW99321.1 hypothetical protein ATY39_07500 [Rummeliibacillus stabekisii]